MNQLKTELEPAKTRQIWDTIRQENKFFRSLLPEELKQVSEISKTLKMFRGDSLAKIGERLSWFGIILLGQVGVYHSSNRVYTLKVSDIINYMHVLPGMSHFVFDFKVLQAGYVSVFLLSDLNSLSVSHPILHYKLMSILCLKSIHTISLQYLNLPFVSDNTVIWSDYPSKKIQEYINKLPEVSGLCLEFFEKNEAKIFQAICKILHLDAAKQIAQSGQYEGCILVLISGEMRTSHGRVVREKEIIGFEQFFFNSPWNFDLVTTAMCDILVIHRSIYEQIASKSLNSSIRIYKFLHRLFLNSLKKNSRFSTQSYFIDVDSSLFQPPAENPNKYKSISFIDVSYNSHNLLPKSKETAGLFISTKFQQQAEQMKAFNKQPRGKKGKEPEKYSKQYLKELLSRTESGFVRLEDELEDAVLYRDEVKEKQQRLEKELEELNERNQELKNALKNKDQDKDVLTVKIKMNQVMKDIGNLEEVKSSMKNPFLNLINRSFFDITQAQIKAHREKDLAVKYASKWKNFVKKRKDFRILQQKNRFWPGE